MMCVYVRVYGVCIVNVLNIYTMYTIPSINNMYTIRLTYVFIHVFIHIFMLLYRYAWMHVYVLFKLVTRSPNI